MQISKTRSDPSGHFIICDINTNSTTFTLCNLYAPNEDKPEFFRDISKYLQDFQCDGIIIAGDKNSLEEVKGICATWDVLDIWRVFNQEEERYTW